MPPRISLPEGQTPSSYLRALCDAAVPTLYPAEERSAASRQLDHELAVIGQLGLEEFFLTVWDIMREAHARRIRCSGRGSAANSITAYLLGITGVDPLRHHLLFERFLNVERATMPDIDVDVQSGRRQELIEYVETRYSGHEAMVANVVQYRLRLAVRDVAKALGFPLSVVNRLTRILPSYGSCSEIGRYGAELAQVLARKPDTGQDATAPTAPATRAQWTHRLHLLLELVPHLEHVPRHLSLHNGGLLLTRWPLDECLPLRRSANGVVAIEIDKDDVEVIGMIKFDLLGLRTFDAIEHCLDLVEVTDGVRPDVDALPLDPPDEPTMALIRAGRTLAVFQLESPAQWNLLSKTRPERFDDLVIQTSICRPGPIQGGMVHPYIARRAGRAPVRYLHPTLEPILRDTLGVILFQEQILQIAHVVAGLTYGEADGFRKAISHYRTTSEMEGMRTVFLQGAVRKGIPLPIATRIFAEIACFSGYGFCRSHAASFAKAIYQTAYLKAHFPAHYLAGFLSAQPAGFFPPATVLHEARLLGIPLLPVDIATSREVYTVERLDGEVEEEGGRPLAIRVALTQVNGVGEELARAIVAERDRGGPFRSLASFCQRMQSGQTHVPLRHDAVAALIRAGAFDGLSIPRRRLLWLLAERWQNWQVPQPRARVRQGRSQRRVATASASPAAIQVPLPLIWPDEQPADAPRVLPLTLREEVEWDLAAQGLSVRPHPLTFRRKELSGVGVVPIAALAGRCAGERALVAGLVISAQRPPTAKGTAFVTLEDETGRVEAVVQSHLAESIRRLLAESRLLAISGRIERSGDHVTLLARALRVVPAAIQPRLSPIQASVPSDRVRGVIA
ncbi:MAG TPA: DNA polymerase III subunit alpha [Steroidobacteraceae bacterium]